MRTENEKLHDSLVAYIAERGNKVCERCKKRYADHTTIVVEATRNVDKEDPPRCAAFAFDAGAGLVAYAPCDKREVLH